MSSSKFTIKKVSRAILLTSFSLFSSLSLSSFDIKYDNPNTLVTVHSSEENYRSGIAGIAQNYLGIPYVLGSRGPATFDCSSFTSYIYHEFGATLQPLARAQAQLGEAVSFNQIRPSDLLFFGHRGNISHVAMIVNRTAEGITVVHCTTSRGVIVENVSQSHYWSPKIMFARNLVNSFFQFAPTSIFANIAAPIVTQTQQNIQVVNAVAGSTNTAAAIDKLQKEISATTAALNNKSIAPIIKSYNPTTNVEEQLSRPTSTDHFSRTYGHSSKEADDADADFDDNGQQ